MNEYSENISVNKSEELIFVPASMWRRLGAFLIDIILILGAFAFAYTIFVIIYMIVSGDELVSENDTRIRGILSLLMIIVTFLYFSILESSSWQATVGKKVFNIIVTDYNTKRIGRGRAILRTFGKYISNSLFFIGYLIGFFTGYTQMLHDFIARTYVLDASPIKSGEEEIEERSANPHEINNLT